MHKCYWKGCNKVYYFKNCVKRHIKSAHLKIKEFECKICHTKFLQKTHLKEHENLHNVEKLYACDVPGCNEKFAQASRIPIHKKNNHGIRSAPVYRKSKNVKNALFITKKVQKRQIISIDLPPEV